MFEGRGHVRCPLSVPSLSVDSGKAQSGMRPSVWGEPPARTECLDHTCLCIPVNAVGKKVSDIDTVVHQLPQPKASFHELARRVAHRAPSLAETREQPRQFSRAKMKPNDDTDSDSSEYFAHDSNSRSSSVLQDPFWQSKPSSPEARDAMAALMEAINKVSDPHSPVDTPQLLPPGAPAVLRDVRRRRLRRHQVD